MPRSGWHRLFHPLCGADLATLLRLIAQNGLPSASGLPRLAIALASSLGRLPFTAAERAWAAFALHRAGPVPPPIFIIGHMRSGTTHLHNLLAASGQFATVPPVLAGMPWEALGLARVLRPFVEQYLPEDRLIDSVRVRSDSPTEDEIALANMHALSHYHAIYFPRRFAEAYRRGLFLDGDGEVEQWRRTLRHYVGKMSALDPGCRLLLKNPGYTAQIGAIRALWPNARFVHIYRNPYVVFESTRRALRTVLRELALQSHAHIPIDEVVLEVYPRMMGRLLEEVDHLPSHALVHVRFEELERDPLGQIERIYRSIRLGDYEAARPRIEAYLRSIHGYSKSTYSFSKESVGWVTECWQPFVTRFVTIRPTSSAAPRDTHEAAAAARAGAGAQAQGLSRRAAGLARPCRCREPGVPDRCDQALARLDGFRRQSAAHGAARPGRARPAQSPRPAFPSAPLSRSGAG